VQAIQVRSAHGSYPVQIGSNLLRGIGNDPLLAGRACFVVTSPRILGLHGQELLRGFPAARKPTVLLVPDGEIHKRLRTIERLASELAQAGAHRDSLLLAFGGGVVGDITGFLAAIYQRGIDFVQIPTTVLAQVDASVGGKTGVNLPEGKNLLGSFHSPRAVFADITTLQTLSDREFRAGLFECIKCGIIRSPKLFRLLERNRDAVLARHPVLLESIVRASVTVKAQIVQRDEHEASERMLLNFGHTFGHALESALHYKTLLHGEAVAWGMLAALHLSVTLGRLAQQDADRAAGLIGAYGPLPRFTLDEASTVAAAARDKKHTQSAQRYVLASAIGDALVAQGIPARDIRNSFSYILKNAARA
jgi:3-dehydroquinate synthase